MVIVRHQGSWSMRCVLASAWLSCDCINAHLVTESVELLWWRRLQSLLSVLTTHRARLLNCLLPSPHIFIYIIMAVAHAPYLAVACSARDWHQCPILECALDLQTQRTSCCCSKIHP